MTADSHSIHLANVAAHAALDKKATDVVAIDVSGVLVITDVFVVCSGSNPRHTAAIVDEVERKVRAAGGLPARREGQRDAAWVLLDFTDIVVHVQLDEERELYGLERLWRDCPSIELEPEPSAADPVGTDSGETDAAQADPAGAGSTEADSIEAVFAETGAADPDPDVVEDDSAERLSTAEGLS